MSGVDTMARCDLQNCKRGISWTLSIFSIVIHIVSISFIYQLYVGSNKSDVSIAEILYQPKQPNQPIKLSNSKNIYHIRTLNQNITLRGNETHNWEMYRLGDMFWSEDQRSKKDGYRRHTRDFPESIAVEYMNKQSANYELMIQIVNERTRNHSELIPNNHTVVIHLRTGDVIDMNEHTVDEFLKLRNLTYWEYTRPLSFYDNIFNEIKSQNITFDHVMIITGFHKQIDHKKSVLYIEHTVNHIERMGYNVTLRINQNPDDDFMIMCSSKYFIKSGGGFSRMIGNIVLLKGGKVFE